MENNDAKRMAARKELARRELERRKGAKPAEEPGMLRKGFDMLNKPSEMSREGLGQLAEMVPKPEPTGNLPLDLVKGAPRIAAETMAEAAPGFIDATSIITAGAAKAVKPIAKGLKMGGRVLSQVGRLSGATPEALQAVSKDASLLLAPGRKAAGKAVGAAADAAKGALRLDQIAEPKKLIDTAEALAKRGKLTPGEAVRARQEVDNLFDSKTITEQAQRRLRKLFDSVAKGSKEIMDADKGFVRGAHAERLRSPVPLTKTGEPRQFITGLLGASALHNPAAALAGAPLYSPLVQALIAAGGGAAVRGLEKVTPAAAVASKNLLEALTKKEK